MPYVNIKLTRDHKRTTADQKEALITGVTQLLADVLGQGQQTTIVIVEEVDSDNFGIGGETVSKRRLHSM